MVAGMKNGVFRAEAAALVEKLKLTLAGDDPYATNAAIEQIAEALCRQHQATAEVIAATIEHMPEKPNRLALVELIRDAASAAAS
jgi:hypothetical protein